MNKFLQLLSNPIAVIFIFGVIVFLRFYHLDADPPFLQDTDFMVDEGGWVHNARNQLLFDTWLQHDHDFPYFAAPGFVYLILLAFKIGGLSLLSARAISAIAGVLTVVVLFLFMKRETSKKEALLTTFFLGFSYFHILYSRVAMAESLLTLMLILTIYLWRLGKSKLIFSFLAGLALTTMFIIKLSALYFLPILLLLLLLEWWRKEVNWRQIILLGLAALSLAIPYLVLFIRPNWSVYSLYNFQTSSISLHPKFIPNFFVFNESLSFSPILLVLTVGFLVDLLINFLQQGKAAIKNLNYPAIVALSICIGNSVLLAVSSVQPPRRYLPYFIAMAIFAAQWITTEGTFLNKAAFAGSKKFIHNFILSAAILFPLFIFVGWVIFPEAANWLEKGLGIELGNSPGIDFAGQMFLLTPFFLLALLGLSLVMQQRRIPSISLSFILITFSTYLASYWISVICDYFSIDFSLWLKLMVGVACFIIFYYTWKGIKLSSSNMANFKAGIFGSILAIQFALLLIWLISPTYSIRDVGLKIKQTIEERPLVTCYSSFIIGTENRIYYGYPSDSETFEPTDQHFILTNYCNGPKFHHDAQKLYYPKIVSIPTSSEEMGIFHVAPYGHPKKPRWIFYLWRANGQSGGKSRLGPSISKLESQNYFLQDNLNNAAMNEVNRKRLFLSFRTDPSADWRTEE